ncbi:MAG TPA: high frequency lysogenization protein HflD [Thalassospira sp.]|nr:high frequency lysogenization protein HflD [Thalassospira sp.]MBA04772.1 high frequency lysogenization protein HflD [Thalassospira sp.]OHY99203.1 high frequency lysogenization protein HflD [Thalassospira sp. MIT1004]HBS21281.1 high frequency lysogenization protein HflD [Thalassospira sp.]
MAFLLAISFLPSNQAAAQASNLLGRGTSSEQAPNTPDQTTQNDGESLISLPGWLSDIVGQVVVIQTQLNRQMTATLRSAKTGDAWWPGLTIIALSFAYGVFHAAGPGHGKMVTTTYFLSRDAGWKQGVAMGSLIAGVQAVTAIVLVGSLTLILNLGPAAITQNGLVLEAVSYALIAGLGGLMCIRILQGRDDCCDHGGHGHDHDHDHDHHAHDHAHHHDHDHEHADHQHLNHEHEHNHDHAITKSRWQMIAGGIVVGLRPCTGSILVLLFTLANGLFLIGIASAFAMAAGVALTISLIGLAAIGIRTGTQHLFSVSESTSGWLRRGVGLAGAALITLFGLLLLLSAARQLGWL